MAVVLAAVSLAAGARSADAKPKRRDAKAAFDRGIAAYQKSNYQGASDALGKSFELEHDPDTLYAWAQAERKLDHYDKAIELYQELLTFNLQGANKEVIENLLAECRTVVARQQPPSAPPSEPAPAPARSPASAPPVASGPAAVPAPARSPAPAPAPARSPPVASGPAVTPPSPAVRVATSPVPVGPPPPEAPPATPREPYVFYKDPVALGLGGAGVVAAGIGVGFLVAAHSASNQAKAATTYQQVQDANSKVDQRNKLGAGGLIAGGALVAGGVGWVLWKRHDAGEQRIVTGWLAPGGGGLVIAGPF